MHRRGLKCARAYTFLPRVPDAPLAHPLTRARSGGGAKSKPRTPFDEVHKSAATILSTARNSEFKGGWKHRRSPQSQETRLVDAILSQVVLPATGPPSPPTVPQLSSVSDMTASDDMSLELMGPHLGIGSLVELQREQSGHFGIIIGVHTLEDTGSTIFTLNVNGSLTYHHPEDAVWVVPNVIDKHLAARCGAAERAGSSTELMARVAVLQAVRDYQKRHEDLFNGMAARFATLHEQVCSPDPEEWAEVSVSHARFLLNIKNEDKKLALHCVHSHLLRRTREFLIVRTNYLDNPLLHVRPRAQVERFNEVSNMFRTKDPRLAEFTRNARQTVLALRELRGSSDNEPPSHAPAPGLEYTDNDRLMINFFLDGLTEMRAFQTNAHYPLMYALMKDMKLYKGDLGEAQIRNFLIDYGVYAPWQDWASRRIELDSAIRSRLGDAKQVQQQEDLVARTLTAPTLAPAQSDQPLGPEDFYPSDPLEHLRHDFGDLPVYVVDDKTAHELDDGISVETIPNEPENKWLHVHIADPTALLPPSHIFAKQAEERMESVYFLHRTYPMLPTALMRERLSLGTSSARGMPENVLTFSAKIDAVGNVLDHKVRVGLIRNVQIMQYDNVDQAMGFNGPAYKQPFGRPAVFDGPAQAITLSERAKNDFQLLKNISDTLARHRLQSPMFYFPHPRTYLSVHPNPLPPSVLDASAPGVFKGFPEVDYAVADFGEIEVGSRKIIAEAAKMACRVASLFTVSKGVPLIHRGLPPPTIYSESQFAELLASRDKRGYVDHYKARQAHFMFTSAGHSLEPQPHWMLALPEGEGYARVTSPLRRFTDLVAHWQIKNALLHGSSYFPRDVMQRYSNMTAAAAKRQGRMYDQHEHVWALLYIQRWMAQHGETGPLANLVGHALSVPRASDGAMSTQMVLIEELGLRVIVVDSQDRLVPRIGMPLNVRVGEIMLSPSGRTAFRVR
ncbi:RNB-domain-containing protein [Auriscalpium vulgare]|uniref:RNB-domain-containing protein n=1 Tax=Auriscalpium vulgare TaxID=40419 RepID=A0ACB8RI38_9AGAM|nr:RNB-domain-containing protein [Auriscalpium vulgare]